MSVKNFVDLSVIELNDGREGTVVMVHDNGTAASIELSGEPEGQIEAVKLEDVKRVIWTP